MDKYDPKNIDSRPKRRRDKDNPYRFYRLNYKHENGKSGIETMPDFNIDSSIG